ncbi:MAG: hypothetical protein ACLTXD_04160 [Clostridia bacterium]
MKRRILLYADEMGSQLINMELSNLPSTDAVRFLQELNRRNLAYNSENEESLTLQEYADAYWPAYKKEEA